MSQKILSKINLTQFTGSAILFRHLIGIYYTEGVRYVAEHAEAYWLLDEIAFLQRKPEISAEEFQVWHLRVANESGTLSCEDGNDHVVLTKRIIYTDFPLSKITFYFCNNTIMLPSEY